MKNIGKDKWRHFYVGAGMGVVFQLFAIYLLPHYLLLGAAIVFFIITVISYGFELFSLVTGYGHHDLMDAVAGVVGGIAGMALGFMGWLIF